MIDLIPRRAPSTAFFDTDPTYREAMRYTSDSVTLLHLEILALRGEREGEPRSINRIRWIRYYALRAKLYPDLASPAIVAALAEPDR